MLMGRVKFVKPADELPLIGMKLYVPFARIGRG